MRAATLDVLVRHRRTRLDSLTEQLVERIDAGNPGYRTSGVVPRDDLVRSCRDTVARVLAMLADAVRVPSGEAALAVDDLALAPARETGRRPTCASARRSTRAPARCAEPGSTIGG